jgi:hypothetical protein
MAKQDVAERARKLIEELHKQRETGDYPLTVAKLKGSADPQATDEEVLSALARKPFVEQVIAADKKSLASPIALAEDAARLAGSTLLLDYALGGLCTADSPLAPLAKVVKQVDARLRPAFQEALERRASSNDWPETVGTHTVKDKVLLYLKQFPPPPPPPPKKSASAELSEKLVAALQNAKASGEYPLSLSRLLALADAEAKLTVVKKAVVEAPFVSEAVLGIPGRLDAPVALAADREALATGPVLLEHLLGAAKKQPVPLAELVGVVAEGLRPAFEAGVRQQVETGSLPNTVGARPREGQLELYRKDRLPPEAVLREQVLARLRTLRETDGYPPALSDVLARVAPGVDDDLKAKLLADKELKAQLVVAIPGEDGSLVALAGDEERLGNSPALLEYAVGLLSTPEKPLWPIAKVAGKLNKALRPAFEAAVEALIRENKLPASVVSAEVKGTPHLRLRKYEPPRPAGEVLAEKLVSALNAQRDGGEYPVLLENLVQGTGVNDAKVVKAALAQPAFKDTTTSVPLPGVGGPLVALAADRERLLADERLLEAALRVARSDNTQAVTVADLTKKVTKDAQAGFATALEKRLAETTLPKSIGSLRIKGKSYVFLLADVGTPPPPKKEEPTPVDFGRLFDEAFARLDQQKGSHNLVSLVTLRQEVAVDRATFDHGLRELRRAGRYSLSAAEGRDGISHEEREAGINEEGTLLLFVSRKE